VPKSPAKPKPKAKEPETKEPETKKSSEDPYTTTAAPKTSKQPAEKRPGLFRRLSDFAFGRTGNVGAVPIVGGGGGGGGAFPLDGAGGGGGGGGGGVIGGGAVPLVPATPQQQPLTSYTRSQVQTFRSGDLTPIDGENATALNWRASLYALDTQTQRVHEVSVRKKYEEIQSNTRFQITLEPLEKLPLSNRARLYMSLVAENPGNATKTILMDRELLLLKPDPQSGSLYDYDTGQGGQVIVSTGCPTPDVVCLVEYFYNK